MNAQVSCGCLQAHRPKGLHNRNVFSHTSRGWKSEAKVLAGWVPSQPLRENPFPAFPLGFIYLCFLAVFVAHSMDPLLIGVSCQNVFNMFEKCYLLQSATTGLLRAFTMSCALGSARMGTRYAELCNCLDLRTPFLVNPC